MFFGATILLLGLIYVKHLGASSENQAPAQSQPILDGTYVSEGTGSIAGQPVTEVTQWLFGQGNLQSLNQVINIGGAQTSGFINAAGQVIGFCKYSIDTAINPPPVPYSTIGGVGGTTVPQFFMLSSGTTLSGGGGTCPFPGVSNTTPLEQYIIAPDSNGNGFSYSEAGDLNGANPVGTGQNDMSIAGHALRVIGTKQNGQNR